jgi:hypothetical protein
LNAWLGPSLADERKALRMKNRLNGEIDVEIRPIKVMRGRHGHIQQLANRRFAEPRKLGKWNEILTFQKQQPEAVHRYVCDFNCRSDRATRVG